MSVLPPDYDPDEGFYKFATFTVVVILALVVALAAAGALGAPVGTKYAEPSEHDWYATLREPDNPGVGCCGEGDAYYADNTDACKPDDVMPDRGQACWFVAIITDTRPDERDVILEDGKTMRIKRPHIEVGTRVPVPTTKRRKVAMQNPTEHSVIFLSALYHYVYCFEPAGGM